MRFVSHNEARSNEKKGGGGWWLSDIIPSVFADRNNVRSAVVFGNIKYYCYIT